MIKIAHLTTVDLSLRYLILPQLEAAADLGEAYGISAPGPHVGYIEERGVIHVPLPDSTRGMSIGSDLKAMVQLWRAVREIDPDIVHTHNPKPGVYGRILARLAGVPIVINTVHGLYATPDSAPLKRVIVYSLEALASRFSDAELVQNPEDLELLRESRIVSPSKLRLLGNGVDLKRFNPDRIAALRMQERSRLQIADDEIVVGMVGRLVEEKGISELIEMAQRLSGGIRVLVAGPNDPDKDDAVSPALLRRGEAAGIEFVGMRPDIDAFYSTLDIFVLPSHREGFPRAAMEAAACGLPMVLTDIRGCRQVVDGGVNGRLVPVRDAQSLTSAVEELASTPDLRAKMGAASAEKARREFDEDRVVDIVMGTYREVADRKGLSWKFVDRGTSTAAIRHATRSDSRAIANLHTEMIDTGFLSSLGSSFLGLLYRSLIRSRHGDVFVAEMDDTVVGFVAGTANTGAFYREFMRRHLLVAALVLFPRLIRPRAWRRIWETFRYGTSGDEEVSAELLSMAVAASTRGRGIGGDLVSALLAGAAGKGIRSMKVVVGSSNEPAIHLYRSHGFVDGSVMEVHAGEPSLELTWRS